MFCDDQVRRPPAKRGTHRRSASLQEYLLGSLLLAVSLLPLACGDPMAPEVYSRPQRFDSNRVRIIIPEVYELANVIIAMTQYGRDSPYAIRKSGAYYQRVLAAFLPFKGHATMQELQLGTSDPLVRYYEFRDNSSAYLFEDGELRRDPAARTCWGRNLFRERLASVAGFAEVSGFRAFFAGEAPHYRDVIVRYRVLAEVDSMADWLEREFPGVRYRYYTVVLSPLVYASHSACFPPGGDEGIFFVAGPDVITATGSEGVKKATVQRLLFTEVDHAFVNPTTDRHRSRINTAFGTRSEWTTDTSPFYDSPTAVFNEYMTWAAFLLFLDGRVSEQDFSEVRQGTVQVMEGRRFHRFGAFASELERLYRSRAAGAHVADLYPQLLDWAATR